MTQAMLPAAITAGGLEQFVKVANEAPYLTAEQEREYGLRLRDQDDIESAQALILSHLRYVIHVARGFTGYGLPLADLVQEGAIGLMKAVRKFDPDHGVRLVSFATHWIKAEIREFIIRNWHIVKIATTKAQRKLFFNLRSLKPRLGHVSQQEAEIIAKELDVSEKDVLEMDTRMTAPSAAFDALNLDDEEHTLTPSDYLADEDADPERALLNADLSAFEQSRLKSAMAGLDQRSRRILQARWLSEPKVGLKMLGDELGISAERVRQLEKQTLEQLRQAVTVPV